MVLGCHTQGQCIFSPLLIHIHKGVVSVSLLVELGKILSWQYTHVREIGR